MKLIEKKSKCNMIFSVGLLIFVVLNFISCGGQEAVEEAAQEVLEPQEKIEQLEKELTEKEEVITELREKIAGLESQIPMSHEVQEGDSHWQISYDYLIQQKGLPAEEAVSKLSDTLVYHPIIVGFKIWNYFYDGTFGSFITQGTASASPGTVMRLKKKEAKEERIGLESQIENLQNQRQDLGEKMDQMQKDYEAEKNDLNDQISTLKKDLNEAQGKNQDLEEELNSVYYLVGSIEELKDQDKVKGTFLGICGKRIKDVTFADFKERIDLRKTDSITLNVSDYNVSQIEKVGLLPNYLEDGKDFQVEIADNQRSARVVLLNKEKVRLARLIVYLN